MTHAITQHEPGVWRCRCGESLGTSRRQARDLYRFHLRDLELAKWVDRRLALLPLPSLTRDTRITSQVESA